MGARETDYAYWTHHIGWDKKLPPKGERGEGKRKKITFVFVFRKESGITQAGLKLYINEDDLGHFISCYYPSSPVIKRSISQHLST